MIEWMKDWKKVKLGDILNFRRGHDLPKYDMREGSIPVAGSNGIIGYHDEATLMTPCITIGRSGNTGTPYIYARCWAHNTVLYIDDFKGNNPYYLYYLLKTMPLSSFSGGSAVPTLNRNHIHPIMVEYCSNRNIQELIVNNLSSFDDKIALNQRINDNLEQQAQALYRSWFVDFEPFKGGKFVDSELGKVPEGWRVGVFSEIIYSMLSGDWGKEIEMTNYSQKVFCIRGADIPDIKVGNNGKIPVRYILPKNFENKALTNNDIVIEISGGSPTQSTGRACHISTELLNKYDNSLICTNFCKAIKPKKSYSQYIYYCWADLYEKGIMFSYENGTTGIKNLDINGLIEKEPILVPSQEIAHDFHVNIDFFKKQIIRNSMENEKLSQIRDSILPKLMSGELKIGDLNS